jgi:Tfp pilus assembly protein PilX
VPDGILLANGWRVLTYLGVLKARSMVDPSVMRLEDSRRAVARACARLRDDEQGIALVMALGIMFVLALILTTVIFITSSSARDAHRSNASQKAYALAEAGIANALAVLNSNYPSPVFPGDSTLLSGTATGEAGCGATGCVSTYASGTTTWNGSLDAAPVGAAWRYQWDLVSTGRVKNPTGPASDIVRTSKAVVPVVIPDTTSIPPGQSSLNWVYGFNDVTFSQSVTVASPVYAGRDLILQNTATIAETIPAAAGNPAAPNKVVAVRNVIQGNTGNNQNHIGHVNGNTDPPASPNNDLGEVHIGGQCQVGNGSLHACVYGTTPSPGDWIFANLHNSTTSGILIPPTFTCCGSGDAGRPVNYAPPVDGTSHPGTPTSDMGFWYINADLGPNAPCATYSSTGVIAVPLRFDKQGVAPTALGADGTIDQSATAGIAPFDLTPPNAGYDCRSASGKQQLSWNGTNATWNGIPKNTLKINGVIFIDGSATSSANPATYVGKGALILSGTFRMGNHEELCVGVQGNNCDTNVAWDPNLAGMFVFADGDFATERAVQSPSCPCPGESIDMKQAQYQGGLFGAKDVVGNVSGTLLEGPLVSAYGSVADGQSGTLAFPPIAFPSSGTDGFTGPFPQAHLLTPRQFGGS